MQDIYLGRLRPIEEAFHFARFYSPCLGPADFAARPSVLLLGQYSTGKVCLQSATITQNACHVGSCTLHLSRHRRAIAGGRCAMHWSSSLQATPHTPACQLFLVSVQTTFIKSMLNRAYPGCNIGPEPTTDRFTVVMHGYEDRQIPGNTLTVSPELPYETLHHFGTGFLSRLEGAQCNASLLHSVTLVDTPGVLSGEKQRIERSYDFVKVCNWGARMTGVHAVQTVACWLMMASVASFVAMV